MSQEFFIRKAVSAALRSPSKNHRHGCVIVRDGEIVSEGFNHQFIHLYHKHSVHAEVDALSKLKHDRRYLSKCDMYVVRIGPQKDGGGYTKLSKPCCDCTKAINKSGLRRVFYS